MSITSAKPVSIKTDLARRIISIKIEAELNNENQEEAEKLVKYRDKDIPPGAFDFSADGDPVSIKSAKPRSIKIDLAKRSIIIAIAAPLNIENEGEADALVEYTDDAAPLGTLAFMPQQLELFVKKLE